MELKPSPPSESDKRGYDDPKVDFGYIPIGDGESRDGRGHACPPQECPRTKAVVIGLTSALGACGVTLLVALR